MIYELKHEIITELPLKACIIVNMRSYIMPQSLSNVLLHIIFSTKNRWGFIDEEIEPELHAYMASIAVSNGSYVHKIGGVTDHVHLFCTLPRTLTISELLEAIKKLSSKWIKTKNQK